MQKPRKVRQVAVSKPNPIGTGRVPHVRLSVRGPKKTGEAHHSFCDVNQQTQGWAGRAIEKYHFRPTYAKANVGHPSSSYGVARTRTAGLFST